LIDPPSIRSRARRNLFVLASCLVLAALGAKSVAEATLQDGPIDLGIIQLRLVFNPGVAFGVGDSLPPWLLIGLALAVTGLLIGYAWSTVEASSKLGRFALAAIMAGGIANVVDRAFGGTVTDYFDLGWWPVFNLSDCFIVVGVGLMFLTEMSRVQQVPASR
jgi:signal peptidase II